jgi:hypothetical protein
MAATTKQVPNAGLSPEFIAYRTLAREAFEAAGMGWNAENAQTVVSMFRNGYTIDELLGSFVLNMPVES